MAKTVPSGWIKGCQLTIKRLPINGAIAWHVERVPMYDYTKDIHSDAISACWFYEWEEFSEFIQWWYAPEQEQSDD